MQAELTLNLKCPSCGSLTPKSLTEIKAQKAFDCECGFHADLTPKALARPARQQREKLAIPA
ncbi:hypothetical protein [Ketobacter alkanivorans]|uniref:Uncharacterized protein n=1 Tax=Ketobacter alkanivorans TaxID=1917421 RepID=A0A2K9LP85_9GAMM|nr:hypothetical protein [Ketobacter alkanivorans]AUM14166.1 hypothetical protein Kalk_17805 [Ketobacter alkanivorans]MCP5018706.1 hypothetical protein [Ketobacter sp.]